VAGSLCCIAGVPIIGNYFFNFIPFWFTVILGFFAALGIFCLLSGEPKSQEKKV